MAIDIGDAVLRFFSDTTQMDGAFASVGPKAKAAFAPAEGAIKSVSDAADDAGDSINKIPPVPQPVPESAKLAGRQLREARGEARLLGEELGIRLPRHVSNFVAELPGVGGALSAAFSATAVLILIKALAEGAEKLSQWVATTFIFTKAMQEQHALLVAENLEVAKQSGLYDAAAKSLQELTDLRTPYEKLQDVLKDQNSELDRLAFKQGEYARTTAAEDQARARALQELIKLTEAQIVTQALADKEKSNADTLKSLQQEIGLRKQLANVQVMAAEAVNGLSKENGDEIRYQISIRALQAQAAAEAKYGKDSVDKVREINAQIEQLQVEHTLKVTEELNKQKEALQTTLDQMQRDVKASDGVEIITPASVQKILQGVAAVKTLGITLRSELVAALQQAKNAEEAFAESGLKDAVALKALQADVKKAQQALDDYGTTMDKTKAKSELTWHSIIQDWHNGANATHATAELAGQAFNQVSSAMTSAFTAAILGQQGWGKALEQATRSAIASLAAQALVKALFYGAEGIAALAMSLMGNPSAGAAATQYFLAAGEMAGIGGIAAGVARSMPGSGGSNTPSAIQQNNGSSSTSGTNRGGVTVTGVQKFATGALISSPTLAIVGDSMRGGGASEAVLPLDHPEAMAKIGAAIAAAGGGPQHHTHINVNGMISPDNLHKVIDQINKRVNRGQSHLTASSSLRLNKRSA